jgi:general stress protein 26
METNDEKNVSVAKIARLIKGIKFAMLTTEENDGSLRSRPMATQQIEFDGNLWFFTDESTKKCSEIKHHQEVNVSFSDQINNVYISISGKAEIVHDKNKMKELWSPFYKTWFPDELNDKDLALLKINVEKSEYWDSPSSKMVILGGFKKELIKK